MAQMSVISSEVFHIITRSEVWVTMLGTWPREQFHGIFRFLYEKYVFPTEIYHQFVDVYGDRLVRQKRVRERSRDFESGRTDIRDDYRTCEFTTSTKYVRPE
jgi:hypothetical protein